MQVVSFFNPPENIKNDMKWVKGSLGTTGSIRFLLTVSTSRIIVREFVISNSFTCRYGNLLVAAMARSERSITVMFGSRFSRQR